MVYSICTICTYIMRLGPNLKLTCVSPNLQHIASLPVCSEIATYCPMERAFHTAVGMSAAFFEPWSMFNSRDVRDLFRIAANRAFFVNGNLSYEVLTEGRIPCFRF